MYKPIIDFTLNRMQARFLSVGANESWLFAGRGTGKTQGCTAPFVLKMVVELPRSSGGLIGQSFADLETKILKPLFMGFEMMGHKLGEHYIYGTKPPDNWVKPLTPILNYKHVISFPNGTTLELVSLHQKGSANSNSFQWIIGPEAKFFNEVQLRQEVFPILRGHVRHFGHSPYYGAKFFETDKYSPDIFWLLEKRKLHDENLVNTVLFYQFKVNELHARIPFVSDSHAYKLKAEVRKLERLLAALRKNMVYVGEGNALDNIANLSKDYIKNMQRSLTKYEFDVAIMNKDPLNVENGFYPNKGEHNLHTLEDIDNVEQPLAIALDYQASISPIVWAQLNDRITPGKNSLNFLGSIFVKHPYGLKHVIDEFCEIHKNRPCKEVIYFFDHTAKGERNMHKKYYEEVTEYFESNGWRVVQVDMGQAPLHFTKYNRINYWLKNEPDAAYQVYIHKSECNSMLVSMDLTETVEGKATQKDKTKEKKKSFPQELAPHLSDTFDQIVWPVCELGLYPSMERIGVAVQFR